MQIRVVAYVAVSFSVAARAQADDPGIRIGGMFGLTGPGAAIGVPYADGIRDYLRYVNDVEGGIKGHKLDIDVTDYGYDVSKALTAYTSLLARAKPSLFFGFGTSDTMLLSPKVTTDRIPYFSTSLSKDVADASEHPFNFFVGTSYTDQLTDVLVHFSKRMHTSAKKQSVVFVHPDNAFGRSGLDDAKTCAKDHGFNVAGEVVYDIKKPDVEVNAQKTMLNRADLIVYQGMPAQTIDVVRALRKSAVKGIVVSLNYGLAEDTITALGHDAEDLHIAMFLSSWGDTMYSGVKLAQKIRKHAEHASAAMPIWYMQGVATAMVALEAMKRTGSDAPSGDDIKKALESMSNFDTGGLTPPVTFTSASHAGTSTVRILRIRGGRLAAESN